MFQPVGRPLVLCSPRLRFSQSCEDAQVCGMLSQSLILNAILVSLIVVSLCVIVVLEGADMYLVSG